MNSWERTIALLTEVSKPERMSSASLHFVITVRSPKPIRLDICHLA